MRPGQGHGAQPDQGQEADQHARLRERQGPPHRPAKKLSLEEYLEWIADDEYLEVTPGALRVRKIP